MHIFETLKKKIKTLGNGGLETIVDEPNPDSKPLIYPHLEALFDEKEALEENPENIDLIFNKYENTFVTYHVYAGKDYMNDKKAQTLIFNILSIFADLELSHTDEGFRSRFANRMKREYDDNPYKFIDTSNWRLKFDKVNDPMGEGFSITFLHNRGTYPKRDCPSLYADQVRYRKALNAVEIELQQFDYPYRILTKDSPR